MLEENLTEVVTHVLLLFIGHTIMVMEMFISMELNGTRLQIASVFLKGSINLFNAILKSEAFMKIEITHLMNRYRECVRHIWNLFFLELLTEEAQWDISDEFDEICVKLFSSLVLNPMGCLSLKKSSSYERSPIPLPCLSVVPSSELGSASIHINTEKEKASGYWNYPFDTIKSTDVALCFIDCFDFDKLGYKNLEYYMVRIVDSSKNSDIIGRNALIRANCTQIFFEEGAVEP